MIIDDYEERIKLLLEEDSFDLERTMDEVGKNQGAQNQAPTKEAEEVRLKSNQLTSEAQKAIEMNGQESYNTYFDENNKPNKNMEQQFPNAAGQMPEQTKKSFEDQADQFFSEYGQQLFSGMAGMAQSLLLASLGAAVIGPLIKTIIGTAVYTFKHLIVLLHIQPKEFSNVAPDEYGRVDSAEMMSHFLGTLLAWVALAAAVAGVIFLLYQLTKRAVTKHQKKLESNTTTTNESYLYDMSEFNIIDEGISHWIDNIKPTYNNMNKIVNKGLMGLIGLTQTTSIGLEQGSVSARFGKFNNYVAGIGIVSLSKAKGCLNKYKELKNRKEGKV